MLAKITFIYPQGKTTTQAKFDNFKHLLKFLEIEKEHQENVGVWATDIKIEILGYSNIKGEE